MIHNWPHKYKINYHEIFLSRKSPWMLLWKWYGNLLEKVRISNETLEWVYPYWIIPKKKLFVKFLNFTTYQNFHSVNIFDRHMLSWITQYFECFRIFFSYQMTSILRELVKNTCLLYSKIVCSFIKSFSI